MMRVGMMVAVMNPLLDRARPRNARRAYASPGRALLAQHLGQRVLSFFPGGDGGENHWIVGSAVRVCVCCRVVCLVPAGAWAEGGGLRVRVVRAAFAVHTSVTSYILLS